ncbi:uncharacterized protein LOC141623608 isoform X1 [Silene latifolia]|uniref:uncharacterized protein LOC141623608 isoform X1 n=1 Tax=Silene latifolia TaxID=37657 RepID=UPI003D76D593
MDSAGKRRKLAEPGKIGTHTAAACGSRVGQPTQASHASGNSSGSGSAEMDTSGAVVVVIEPLKDYPSVVFGSTEQRERRLPPPGWPHPSYFRFPEGGYSSSTATADAVATVSEPPTTTATAEVAIMEKGTRGDGAEVGALPDDDPCTTGAG